MMKSLFGIRFAQSSAASIPHIVTHRHRDLQCIEVRIITKMNETSGFEV